VADRLTHTHATALAGIGDGLGYTDATAVRKVARYAGAVAGLARTSQAAFFV
jgi:hypothetical protein